MQPQLKIYHGKHFIKCKIVLKIKFKEQTQVNYQTTSWWTLCAKWICFHQRHYHVFSNVMDWSSISIACEKHQQSLYDDDVDIRVMHPTLSSNRMIVSSMIAGQWSLSICVTHIVSCSSYL